MSVADRPTGTWHINSKELDDVVATILKDVKLDRDHDCPYVAGYSNNGKIIYIDHQMPKGFPYKGKMIETDRYLIVHESVERNLEAGPPKLKYLLAHQIAYRTERDCVIVDGIPWNLYDQFMMKQVKLIGGRASYPNCPKDLDLEPYRDSKDRATLRKMHFEKR